MLPPDDAWWTRLPPSTWPSPTDICSVCGHCRSLHRQYIMGIYNCDAVSICGCGPMVFPYHIAGYDGPRDTVTNNGYPFPVDQPRKPKVGFVDDYGT